MFLLWQECFHEKDYFSSCIYLNWVIELLFYYHTNLLNLDWKKIVGLFWVALYTHHDSMSTRFFPSIFFFFFFPINPKKQILFVLQLRILLDFLGFL